MADRAVETFDPTQVSENEIYRFLTARAISQNQLLYSRVQTMLTIKVAAVAAVLTTRGAVIGLLVLLLASVLITLFWLLARRDRQAQIANLDILDRVHKPLGIMLIPPPAKNWQRGALGVTSIFLSMLVANVALAVVLLRAT